LVAASRGRSGLPKNAAALVWPARTALRASGASKWVQGVITLFTTFSIVIVLARIATAFVRSHNARTNDAHQRITIVENLVRVLIYIFGILMVFHNLGVSITPVLTALGVGGLAVALALQDTLSNLFAGLYIIVSKQLDPGDYVKLDSGQEGTVNDIAWRVTTIRTPQNTLVVVPNSKFASSIFTNFDRPEKISTITIPFEIKSTANINEISGLLTEIANEVIAEVDGADKSIKPQVRFAELTQDSITINLIMGVEEYRVRGRLRDALYRKFFERISKMYPGDLPLAPKPEVVKVAEK
jgi:small-conductance mechanosensitive channel